MAGNWVEDRFAPFEAPLRRLVEQHRQLTDEPLHLAVAYEPGSARNPNDVYLFEAIGVRFDPYDNPDRDLFETTFGPASGFPLAAGQYLHFILTDPDEYRAALDQDWPSAREVADAVRRGQYRVLFADDTGDRLLDEMRHVGEAARG